MNQRYIYIVTSTRKGKEDVNYYSSKKGAVKCFNWKREYNEDESPVYETKGFWMKCETVEIDKKLLHK